jgi:hypothetical protein
MAWERFDRQQVAMLGDPTVTIQKGGVISINGPSYRALHEPAFVELFYELSKQLVGIAAADPASKSAYKVRPLKNSNSTWLISGTSFARYYKIDTDVAKRWIAIVAPDGMLVIDLKQQPDLVSGNRLSTFQERSPTVASSDRQGPDRDDLSASPAAAGLRRDVP